MKRYLFCITLIFAVPHITKGRGMDFFNDLKTKLGSHLGLKGGITLEKDIVDYWALWALTPTVTCTTMYLLHAFKVLNILNRWICLKWLGAYLLGGILCALLFACEHHFMIQKTTKRSFKTQFIRCLLFFMSSAWTPILVVAFCQPMQLASILLYAILLSSLLTLCVVVHDHQRKSKPKI